MRTNTTLKTKAMSILLAIVMLLGMLPISVFAADTTYTVTLAVNRTDLGSVSGDGEYANGAAVTLTATAKYDNVFFAYWLDNSVTLSEEPMAAELEAAIVSYDSTYTFTAAQNVSLTAVFAYNSSISVNGMYYANEDEIFSGEGSGTNIEEIATTTEIGKQSVTISASDYNAFVTIDNVVYERNCMFTWTYDQTTGQITYTTHDSFSIPVAPIYNSVEYWAYLAEYEAPVTIAYVPHTHSYSAVDYNGDNHWDVCSCGDKKDEAAHKWTYTYDDDLRHTMVCTVCEYEAGGSHFGIINTMVDDDHHWWNLPCCGNEKNKGSHTYDNAYATQCNATFGFERCTYDRSQSCTHSWGNYSNKNDVHEKTCSKCGLTVRENHFANTYNAIAENDTINAAAHTEVCACGKSWEAAHELIQTNPNAHTTKCTLCIFSSDNHVYTVFKPSEANPETYHVAYCFMCGEMSDPVQVAGHNYGGRGYGPAEHWDQCTDCGHTTGKTAHQMTAAPNDGDDATHIVYCGGCEYAKYEDCVFDAYDGDEDYHWTVCSACGDTPSRIGMQAHVDENADGTCDVCNEKYTPPHTHSYKDKYDSTGHYTECDCGEKTEVQAHSYTGMFDSTCDCGYDRGLFKVGTVDTDYVEVGFIPGDGVTLPDDAELVVEDHYPSLAPIASTIVKKTSLGDFRCPEEYDILTDEDTVGIYGIECKLYETIMISGREYILLGSSQDGAVLIRFPDGRGMVYSIRTGRFTDYPDSSFDRTVEKPTNTTVTIDGVTYDVAYIVNNSTYILYRDGQLAGMYPSTDAAVDLHGSVQFYEGYDPETLKAQQDDNDLGTVTIPADYNNAAIADFAPGKTYKVSVIGSNDISVKGYDDALLNSITEDTPEIAAAKAELERLKADMDAKWWALTQMDINDPNYTDAEIAYNEASQAYASALASLADLTNLQGATVSQTYKIPDALIGAKTVQYVAVHDTNPHAAELAEAERVLNSYFVGGEFPDSDGYYQARTNYDKIKAHYDAWEKENGSGAEYGTVTVSDDGKIVTVTYAAVDSFSPFIVYAFVEADEPEYKELSATLHTEHTYENGKCTVCEAVDPDYNEPTDSPQTGSTTPTDTAPTDTATTGVPKTGDNGNAALWLAVLLFSGGALVPLTVYDKKRRKAVTGK